MSTAPDTALRTDTTLRPASKCVVIVSPHFPPSTLAGVHRARHLAKHLPAFGWRPIVVRVDERHYSEAPDPALSSLVPDTVEQVRTWALPASLARILGIGDVGLRAYHSLASEIEATARKYGAGAILITGSPFYPMLLAERLRRRLNLPVVLDFQDPWVNSEGRSRPYFSKGRMAHRLAEALEPRAVRGASWITSVSERQNDELAARYPWLDRQRMTAIPIGGDPGDFLIARNASVKRSGSLLDPSLINLCYVGTFLPRAGPVVRVIFEAAARLRRERPDLASRLRFVFVGTSNQPAGSVVVTGAHRVMPLATEAGVADLVVEHPARVPFADALALNANASALLLLGSDEPHYTASKIYPAMMSGRPFLSLFHAQSSSHEILSRAGGGSAFCFGDVAELPGLVAAVAGGIVRVVEDAGSLGKVDPDVFAPYTARAVSGQFADVLNKVAT